MPTSQVLESPAPPPPGRSVRVTIGDRTLAIFNLGSGFHAIDAACTHVRGPLDQGRVDGTVVTCPWHGSQFDLRTGEVRKGPAARPVATYPVRVDQGKLVVELP
jgi:nitrite reductase/ring-hydroxylating ferredoxin subunit